MTKKSIPKKHFLNKIGDTFGKLTLIASSPPTARTNKTVWLCRCECGNIKPIRQSNLRMGSTKSCGCLRIAANKTHGQSKSRINKIWSVMKQRCLNPNNKAYKDYGGRGIKLSERWLKFENFLADVGEQPSRQHSIDRIDNNGHYEKNNVRWATNKEQARNRRNNLLVTINGETKCVTDWSEHFEINRIISFRRIYKGWCAVCAVTLPLNGECVHKRKLSPLR